MIKTPEEIARETWGEGTGFHKGSGPAVVDMMITAIEADREQLAIKEAIHAEWARRIFEKLDVQLERILTLHDIGKALPHPYNALGDYANSLAHDYAQSVMYDVAAFRKSLEGTK